jgi:hypothetical protein
MMGVQLAMSGLLEAYEHRMITSKVRRTYSPWLTVTMNRKGVLDVDTVKGCSYGMVAYPNGGCYGECYAARIASRYGVDFGTAVSRRTFCDLWHLGTIYKILNSYAAIGWYRVGVAGDPCHDWANTVSVVWALRHQAKAPVIITKHWAILTDEQIDKLRRIKAVVNTSVSGLDTDSELAHRVSQAMRLRAAGVHSPIRIVTCEYGTSAWARSCNEKQEYLLSLHPIIDNPLRARKSNPRVLSGDVVLTRRGESIGGGKMVSLHDKGTYLGACDKCPDKCGVGSNGGAELASGELLFENEAGC